jgi:hypothetical protein
MVFEIPFSGFYRQFSMLADASAIKTGSAHRQPAETPAFGQRGGTRGYG